MNNIEILGMHFLEQMQKPDTDSEQWLAYLCLKVLRPTTEYWTYDGYHIHALVDYSVNLLWEDDSLMSTDRGITYCKTELFYKADSRLIVQDWLNAVGWRTPSFIEQIN